MAGLVAPEAEHLSALQHAQNLGLRRERYVADLVEERGPGVRRLEEARLRADRAGERVLFESEKLGLERRGRSGRAAQLHERCARARGARVDLAGEDVFADPGFSQNEDAEHRRRNAVEHRVELLHSSVDHHRFVRARRDMLGGRFGRGR